MVCDHRDAAGRVLDTWFLDKDHEVCARCVHGTSVKSPVRMRDWLVQADFAALEMRAMTAMMREVGIEFVGDEAMGTAEQYEEFKRRWSEKYPDRTFAAKYGSKTD